MKNIVEIKYCKRCQILEIHDSDGCLWCTQMTNKDSWFLDSLIRQIKNSGVQL